MGYRPLKLVRAWNADDAVKKASEIGFPVALKLNSETITHKSHVGGVALNLSNEERSAVRALISRWSTISRGNLVRPIFKV